MDVQQDYRLKIALVAVLVVAALAWVFLVTGNAGEGADLSPTAPGIETPRSSPDSGDAKTGPDLARRSLVASDSGHASVRVRGRVLDPDGDPVGRALVGDAASDRPGVTAQDGRFEVFAEGGRTSITLLVLAAGHAPFLSRHGIEPTAQTCDAGDIQILRGGEIRGKVTDQMGNGLQGALATLRPRSGNAWPPSLDLTKLLPPVSTAADGSYSFANLTPGRYRVTASAPGMQDKRSPTMTVNDGVVLEVDPLVLQVGYDLTGLVLGPDHAPVAGASVRIRNGRNQTRYDGQAETKGDGRFEFSSVPPGPLRVEVTKSGFLTYSRSDVDPTPDEELVLRLEGGLRLMGTVVDSRTSRPVEKFAASIRRVGRLDPPVNGSMAQQLQRRVESLRAAAVAPDPEVRARQVRIATELETRLRRVRQKGTSRPIAVPTDVGPVMERPEGRFSFGGLDEGLYSVGIASLEHAFAQVGPVDVRRGMPAPALRVELVEGHTLSGLVVSKHDGTAIANAKVELVRVLEAPREEQERQSSLYPWVFARSGPQGVTVMTTRTDDEGRFEFRNAAPGRCLLSIRHAAIADHDTEAFQVQAGRQTMRVTVGARASLTGRVLNIPPGQEGKVEVVVLGGHGTMRTEKPRADGMYRFDGLHPGSYIVRAFPEGSRTHVNRLFGSIFPLHAGAVDHEKIPQRDVVLAEGATRTFDVAVDLPPTGVVQGTVSVNGQPGRGGRAILRPLPGEAPGSGGLSLRGNYDDLGQFTIRDVPAGKYTLTLSGTTRQELYRKPITVSAGATATVQVDLAAGGLRGRVTAPDAAPTEGLRGYLWVLPGATEAPVDLYAYRRSNRTHRIRVRNAVFEDQGLTPGPAVLVVDIPGRNRVVTKTVIPTRDLRELELVAEPAK